MEQIIERIFHGARLGLIEVDSRGIVRSIDRSALRSFDIQRAEDIVGRHYGQIPALGSNRRLRRQLRALRGKSFFPSHKFAATQEVNGHVIFAYPRTQALAGEEKGQRHLTLVVSRRPRTLASEPSTLTRLKTEMKALGRHHPYSLNHSIGVATLAGVLAERLGFTQSLITLCQKAGLTHDIGKKFVRKRLLDKKGHLTKSEMAEMDQHNWRGAQVVGRIYGSTETGREAVKAAMLIRRRGGKPTFRHGAQPTIGEIVHVADSIRAMLEMRRYKEGLPLEFVLSELEKNRGPASQFHPRVAQAAAELLQEAAGLPPMK